MRTTTAASTTMTLNGVAGRQALRKALLVVMALSLLVALPAVPAAADHSSPPGELAGSGELEGTEEVLDEVWMGAPCFKVSKSIFALRGAGSFHGRTAEGQEVVYQAEVEEGQPLYQDGPLEVTVENTGTYYHGPFGTHGGDTSCSPATTGTEIPAKFTIFAADHVYVVDGAGAQAPCTGHGTFSRTDMFDDPNWRAEWTLEQDCVVVGNDAGTPGTGVAPEMSVHTHHGVHKPCSGYCADNFRVDYRQYLPVPGVALHMGGPATTSTGNLATVTARITEDGHPVAKVPVTFSVAGPLPSVPPAGTAVTGTDGRASFAFTAADVGDYTVTASATHAGEVTSGTHTVRFVPPAPPDMTVHGPDRAQTEHEVTVGARVAEDGESVPGVEVEFTVEGPGQATPASGSALTGADVVVVGGRFVDGAALFTFSADRAGDYTVTASASHLGEELSAAHTVHMEINTFYREDSVNAFPEGENNYPLSAAVVDPAGDYAYFASGSLGNALVKVDLNTFQRVGAIALDRIGSAVIDPAGDYAYFATGQLVSPGRVVKVDLHTFERVGAITLNSGEENLASAVIDPAGDYAYFGTSTSAPGQVVKVDLRTFERVGAVTLQEGEGRLDSAVMDPAGDFAYFGAQGSIGSVVKIDLRTFQRAGAVRLHGDTENRLNAAVIDPAGDYAYFGTNSNPARVVRIDLTFFRRAGSIDLNSDEADLRTAVIDPAGDFAYFSGRERVGGGLERVVKVDLAAFERAHAIILPSDEWNLVSAVMAPDGGHAYYGTTPQAGTLAPGDEIPAKVVKVALTRPPNPALVAGDDAYATDFRTPLEVPVPGVLANDTDTGDGDPLSAHDASDPAGGSVELDPDGSFTYTPHAGFAGTDTFTYRASDGMDYSSPATVTVEVAAPTEDDAEGSAFGYYTDVSMFQGPSEIRGHGQAADAPASAESPSVACPEGGGADNAAKAEGARAVYGPAVIFGGIWPDDNEAAPPSGPMTAHIDCQLGADGHVTASTSVTLSPGATRDTDGTWVEPTPTWETPGGTSEPWPGGAGPGPFIADEVHSSCTMTPDGTATSDVTIGNGILETQYNEDTQEPTQTEPVPESPPVNYTRDGTLDHVGDSYRVVFNEQIENPDGSLTVNAVHMYLLGPTAEGDMVIGSSTCGPVTVVDQPDTGAVAGQVTDAATDTPPDSATVTATDADSGESTATTDADGNYTLPGLAPGDYTVSVDADGYEPASQTATVTAGQTTTVDFALQQATGPARRAVADFDGNGATDVGVFRPTTGRWHIRGVDGLGSVGYGLQGDIPVPGDYDGDGVTDVAVFRPDAGRWYVRGVEGLGSVNYGMNGDVPVPGDYDGDGTTDIAVFRPTTGRWYVRGVEGLASVGYGTSGDIPVPGDYDGDGTTDIAVFRPTTGRWYVRGVDGLGSVGYGAQGDVPVPGDYDGDGATDIAVFRPTTGRWHVRGVPDLGSVGHGMEGDIPVPGDYSGDGTTDIAVFRPDAGRWYVHGAESLGAVNYGMDGDIPVVMAPALHQTFFPPASG